VDVALQQALSNAGVFVLATNCTGCRPRKRSLSFSQPVCICTQPRCAGVADQERSTCCSSQPRLCSKWVTHPALKLNARVMPIRHTASSQPNIATLRKNASGSIDGEAIQKDITGANGTPPINSAAITGMTPHEQNGLKAPTAVASKMDTIGLP
jgi:hypothetical protein